MSDPQIYSGSTLQFTGDESNPLLGASSSAFAQYLENYIANATASTKTLYFLVAVSGQAATTIEYNAIFDGNGNIEIDGVLFDAAATELIVLAIAAAVPALSGAPLVAVSIGVSIAYSELKDTAYSWYDQINGTSDVDIRLYNQYGVQEGGALYGDGLGSTSELTAVKNLVAEAIQGNAGSLSDGNYIRVFIKDALGIPELGAQYGVHDIAFSQIDTFLGYSFGTITNPSDASISNSDFLVSLNGQEWVVAKDTDQLYFLDKDNQKTAVLAKNVFVNPSSGADASTGNDLIIDTDGNSIVFPIFGLLGDDYIYGGSGDDEIYGGGNNDTLYGDGGTTTIQQSGDDILDGGSGNDYLYGGSGNDELNGGDDRDFLYGGAGDDIIISSGGNYSNKLGDVIDGGTNGYEGVGPYSDLGSIKGDTIDYSYLQAGQAVYVNLGGTSLTVAHEDLGNIQILGNEAGIVQAGKPYESVFTDYIEQLTDIENVFDTANTDVIIGSAGTNVIKYTGGSDYYDGGESTDYYFIDTPGATDVLEIRDNSDGVTNYAYLSAPAGEYTKTTEGDDFVYTHTGGGKIVTDANYNTLVVGVDGKGVKTINVEVKPYPFVLDDVQGERTRLQLDTNEFVGSGGGGGPSPSVVDVNVTPTKNYVDQSTSVNILFTYDDGSTGQVDCNMPWGDWPVGSSSYGSIEVLIDGKPFFALSGPEADLFYYPEFGEVAGLKVVEDNLDTFVAGNPEDVLFGGVNALPLPDDLDTWTYTQTTYINLSHSMDAVYAAFAQAEQTGSPLVFDLDGDGVELTNLDTSNVFWDLDEDGFAERSGWVSADDGILAIDLDGDGYIKDQSELFGDLTEDGFTALSAYDTNFDNVIDANDAQFGDLLIWRDLNQNGIGGASELFTLTELNITSIGLGSTVQYQNFVEGNQITHIGGYTYDDGISPAESRDVYDVWFQYDNRHSLYNQSVDIDSATFSLPNFAGYGNLPSLQIAMSLDNDFTDPNSLISLVSAFAQKDFLSLFSDDGSVRGEILDIMFRWAGVDTLDPTSRGVWVDARELAFIEALTGEGYQQRGGPSDPGSLAGESIDRAFETSILPIFGRILAQVSGAQIFEGELTYDAFTDSFTGFTAFNADALSDLVTKSKDANQVQDKVEFWKDVIRMVDHSVGVNNIVTSEYNKLEAKIKSSDSTLDIQQLLDKIQHDIDRLETWSSPGDYILGTSLDDVYTGSVGDDFYSGGGGNDILSGGIGNDKFYGGGGNDILNGELGDDYFMGDGGDDTYLFYLGHGDDTLLDSSGNDKILFGPLITATDLSFIRVGTYDLTVQIDPAVGYGSITIVGHFSGGVIETLEFDDATTLDLNSLDYTYVGTSANETIYGVRTGLGGSGVDTLYGNGGDDVIRGTGVTGGSFTEKNTIYGGDGNDTIFADNAGDYLDGGTGNDVINGGVGVDTLIGGTGDDTLKGGRGNDTYIFNYGDGNDLIEENRDNDTIVFGAGITAAMLDITRLNINDVIIMIDGGLGGSIELNWQTYGAGYIVETIQFDDASTLDLTLLDYTLHGTSAAETLYGVYVGGSGVDTIYGHEGNDVIYGYRTIADYDDNFLYGGTGNDTVFAAHGVDYVEGGEGDDLVYGYNGNDEIYGGAGNDNLRGGNHDDVLYGEAGDDILLGENNNDILIGGLGIDTLTGGGGYDTFTFQSGGSFDNVDTITDFNSTYDSIDISDLLVGYDPLTDAITDFVQITDDGVNSTLSVDADGGANAFVAIATLTGKIGLTDEEALETSGTLIAA